MAKKLLYLAMGAVLITLGILTTAVDGLAGLLCGIGMLLYGAGNLAQWFEHKESGSATFFSLIGAMFSIVIGIIVISGSSRGQAFALHHVVLSLDLFLIGSGVLEILGAVMYRKAMTSVDLGVQAPGSVLSIILGAALIALGLVGVLFPHVASLVSRGIVTLELFVTGLRLLWQARSAGVLEESD